MDTLNLDDYLRPLRRWWWLIALATLLAALSSTAYTLMQPPQYRSGSTLMIGPTVQDLNPNNNQLYTAQHLAQMYGDVANRSTIRQGTMDALGMTSLPPYTAYVVPNTQFIEIMVTDVDPARAQAVAAELVRQLHLQSPAGSQDQQGQEFTLDQLAKLEGQITETEEEIVSQQANLAELFSARQIAQTEQEIAALQNKLSALQSNYIGMKGQSNQDAINRITIIDPPNLPGQPMPRQLRTYVLLAMLSSCTLAIAGAYLLDYFDDSIRTTVDVRRDTGLATLGAIPLLPDETDGKKAVIMLESRRSIATEAFRSLRTNLQYAATDRPLNLLLVTSPAAGEGKSVTSANLAASLARTEHKVVIVDADLHRPRQHQLFGLSNRVGVTTAVQNMPSDVSEVVQPGGIPGLYVLTSGPLPANPSELLDSHRMQALLNAVVEWADIVVLDSPPVTAVADTASIAPLADAVLLVLRIGKSSHKQARRTIQILDQVGVQPIGVVLNSVNEREVNYSLPYGAKHSEDQGEMSGASSPTAVDRGVRQRRSTQSNPLVTHRSPTVENGQSVQPHKARLSQHRTLH